MRFPLGRVSTGILQSCASTAYMDASDLVKTFLAFFVIVCAILGHFLRFRNSSVLML